MELTGSFKQTAMNVEHVSRESLASWWAAK
jgi:hypothetical protein